jgi:hypothetical protein
MPAGGGSATPRRISSCSGTRKSLPESKEEQKRADDALRKHKLVSHEAPILTDDPVHCFFHAFLARDEWACTGFPIKHLDIFALRLDAKKWLRDHYKILHLKGIINDWLKEYPAIDSRIKEAGDDDDFYLFLQKQQPAHRYIPIAYVLTYADSLSKKSKKRRMANFLQWLRTQWFPATAHANIWEIITWTLPWQTSTLLP